MGSHISVRITPYLKVEGVKEVKKIKVKRFCPNHPNMKQSEAKFCSQCGEEIVSEYVPYTEKLSPRELLWRWDGYKDDKLYFSEEMEIVLPNQSAPNKISFDAECGDVVDLSDRTLLIQKQMDWFKETYKGEIAFLKEELGDKNVVVCWGVVGEWG